MVTNDLRTGPWTDETKGFFHRYQVLTTDFGALTLTSLVVGWITLVTPHVLLLLWSFGGWLKSLTREETLIDLDDDHAQPDPDPRPRTHRQHVWKTYVLPAFKVCTGTAIRMVAVALFVAGVFAPRIATQTAALSASEHCGYWQFDQSLGLNATLQDYVRTYRKEERASQYAQECYSGYGAELGAEVSFGCNFFFNQSIKYTRKPAETCPFTSDSMCIQGHGSTTFDTGFVSTATVGLNTGLPYGFRRTSTCSPVAMSKDFIKRDGTTFYYDYGHMDDSNQRYTNYTYKTEGNPFSWLTPDYSVDTYYYSFLDPERSYWTPLPGLMPHDNHSTITIAFIQSHHLFHYSPVYDPVFRASATFPSHDNWFYNADPRARPLACVDTTKLCYGSSQNCWSMRDPLPDHVPDRPEYWMMKWSLENSYMYPSIEHRLGASLLAQKKIGGYFSAPLGSSHWEDETENFFTTSLARIQWDAWSIAVAEDRDVEHYFDNTQEEAKGRLCGLFKFKKVGYNNVNSVAFLGTLIAAILIRILALKAPVRMDEDAEHSNDEEAHDRRAMVAEVFGSNSIDCILSVVRNTSSFIRAIPGRISHGSSAVGGWFTRIFKPGKDTPHLDGEEEGRSGANGGTGSGDGSLDPTNPWRSSDDDRSQPSAHDSSMTARSELFEVGDDDDHN